VRASFRRTRRTIRWSWDESCGGESERIIFPFFIADNSHFLDMLTLFHHEAHVTLALVPLHPSNPSYEIVREVPDEQIQLKE
jgi:hypothetical protein